MSDNQDTRQEMDAELFEALDEGLRSVFDKHVRLSKNLREQCVDSTFGSTAAQAARVLVQLHRDCKPTPKR